MGEAALPPYLVETPDSVRAFIDRIDWSQISYPFPMGEVHAYLNSLSFGDYAAKAAVDMALHDIKAQMGMNPVSDLFATTGLPAPPTSLTFGISTPDELLRKFKDSKGFTRFKLKLGGPHDRACVEALRQATPHPINADANQAWTDKEEVLDMLHFLHENGVKCLEQPMPVGQFDDMCWLKERSPMPLIADESFQTLEDLAGLHGGFHGINIKLMKCGGIYPAMEIIHAARIQNMSIQLGCMTESSLATYAALVLAPLVDTVDLDGPWMVSDQPFATPKLKAGRIVPPMLPGIGAKAL